MDWLWWILVLVIYLVYLVYMRYHFGQMIEDYHVRYVFITGCDTGFGHMLALRLDKMGYHVFAGCLTEKGEDELRKESSQQLDAISLDVTKEQSIRNALEYIKRQLPRGIGLWGLVNNAGIAGPVGPSEWLRKEDYLRTLEVNLFGMIETTRIFLPLVRHAKGRIVNMASILGTITLPYIVPYGVAKHGVGVFSDSLRTEARQYGVSVHIIQPGYFNTNICKPDGVAELVKKSFENSEPNVRSFYGKDFVPEFIKFLLNGVMAKITSKATYKVVDAYVHALGGKYPRARYTVGWDANILFRILRFCPEWLTDTLYLQTMPKPIGVS